MAAAVGKREVDYTHFNKLVRIVRPVTVIWFDTAVPESQHQFTN